MYAKVWDAWTGCLVERCLDRDTADARKAKAGRIVCKVISGGRGRMMRKRTSIPGTNGGKHRPLIVPRF